MVVSKMFVNKKLRDCIIYVVKTKALISAQLLIELIQQRFSGDQSVVNDEY